MCVHCSPQEQENIFGKISFRTSLYYRLQSEREEIIKGSEWAKERRDNVNIVIRPTIAVIMANKPRTRNAFTQRAQALKCKIRSAGRNVRIDWVQGHDGTPATKEAACDHLQSFIYSKLFPLESKRKVGRETMGSVK